MKKVSRMLSVLLIVGVVMSTLVTTPMVTLAESKTTRGKLVNLYESIGTRIYYKDKITIKSKTIKLKKAKKKTYVKRGKVKVTLPKAGKYTSRDSVNFEGLIFHTDTYEVVMTQTAKKYKKGSKKAKKITSKFVQKVKIRHPEGTSFKIENIGGSLYLTSVNPYNIYDQAMFTYWKKDKVKDPSPELDSSIMKNGIGVQLTFGKADIPHLITGTGKTTVDVLGNSDGVRSYEYRDWKVNKKYHTGSATIRYLTKFYTPMNAVSESSKEIWKGTKEYVGGE